MFRQHSNRHQRSKGFKLKHALQICVLLGVCIWLLYQVKHSHDKKKELEERKSAGITEPHIMKFGRKDLPDNVAGNDSHEEEENEGEEDEHDLKKDGGEEEEDRGDGMDTLEENDQEKDEESKGMGEGDVDENDQENGEEGKDAGDDELDENDQENDEHENGGGDDELDGKKGYSEEGKATGGELDEKIKEVVDSVDSNENEGKSDNLLLKGMDNEDDNETDSQEARELHYKGDDASSAVVKSAEAIQSEENHQGGGKVDEENTENKPEMSNGDKADGNSVTEKIGESGNYSVSDAPGAGQEQVDTAILNPILNLTNVVDDTVHVNGTLLNSTTPELNEKSTASELSKEMEQRNSTLEVVSNHTVEDGGKILQEILTEVPQAVTEESDQPNRTLEVVLNHTVEEDGKIPQENSTMLPEMVPDLSQKNESANVVLNGDHYKNDAKILADSKILGSESNMNLGNATVELTGKINMTVNAGDSDDTSNDSSALDDDIKALLKDAGGSVTDDTGESSKEDTNSDDQKDVQTDLSALEEIEMDATPEDLASE